MRDPGSEQSSVDARGIRPPNTYAIEQHHTPEGVVVLALEGEFDLAAAPTVGERLAAASSAGAGGVVLDMAEVTFVDSSALRELLRADAVLSEQGARLVLAALRPAVARLLELTRTTGLLTVAPTVEEALRRAAPPQIGSGLGSGGSGRGSGTGVGGAGSGPGEGSGPGIGGSG